MSHQVSLWDKEELLDGSQDDTVLTTDPWKDPGMGEKLRTHSGLQSRLYHHLFRIHK